MTLIAEQTKWAYSLDERRYQGEFATWWEAVLAGLSRVQDVSTGCWVGRCEPPDQPDDMAFAEWLIAHVQEQDHYRDEYAAGWPGASQIQIEELDAAIGKAFGDWLDRHGLRPRFFVVNQLEFRTKDEALAMLHRKSEVAP